MRFCLHPNLAFNKKFGPCTNLGICCDSFHLVSGICFVVDVDVAAGICWGLDTNSAVSGRLHNTKHYLLP